MKYYLDIETTGLDELHNKITTIQYMELDKNTGKAIGPLKILKEWESDEKTILTKFISDSGVDNGYMWDFVPFGFNLPFEHKFFLQRCKANDLEPVSILGEIGNPRPHIDLKLLALLKNQYEFKGSSLDFLTNKPRDGRHIPNLYAQKKYLEIEGYIKNEATEFISLCQWLSKDMPAILEKFRTEN